MTHPHVLHASAACWSLHHARLALTRQADAEAASIAAERLEAADGIRAWRPLPGRAYGGHSDPAAGAALAEVEPADRANRFEQLATSTTDTLRWLADQLHAQGACDPLQRLEAAIPALLPGTCATLTRWLTEADERIRLALGMQPDRWPLPGAPACPACSVRMLRAQTSAPDTALWTVVCTAGCRCLGDSCPCGMAVLERGVTHIWDRSAPLVAGELARLPRRRV